MNTVLATLLALAPTLAVLLTLSGLISAAETSMTAASRGRMHQLERDGDRAARRVNRLIGDQENMIGAILLWPSGTKAEIPLPFQDGAGGSVTTERGQVQSSSLADCGSPSAGRVLTADPAPGLPGSGTCVQALIAIETGPNTGADTMLELSPGPGQPDLQAGQSVRIFRQVDQQGATGYGFYDYERTWPLTALAAVFDALRFDLPQTLLRAVPPPDFAAVARFVDRRMRALVQRRERQRARRAAHVAAAASEPSPPLVD